MRISDWSSDVCSSDLAYFDVRIDAVKIGMLGQQTIIRTVAERLAHWKPQYLIVGPVMVAKSGDHLLEPTAIGELRDHLLPLATMVTPHLPEAGILLNSTPEIGRAHV